MARENHHCRRRRDADHASVAGRVLRGGQRAYRQLCSRPGCGSGNCGHRKCGTSLSGFRKMDYGAATQWRSNQPGPSIVDGSASAADLSGAVVFVDSKIATAGKIMLPLVCNPLAARRSQKDRPEPAAECRPIFFRFKELTEVPYGSD